MVFQEFSLVPTLSVAQNVYLTREPRSRGGLIDDREMERRTRDLFATMSVDVDPRRPLDELPTALRAQLDNWLGVVRARQERLPEARALLESLSRLGNANAAGEYYITDCPGMLLADGRVVDAVDCLDTSETLSSQIGRAHV